MLSDAIFQYYLSLLANRTEFLDKIYDVIIDSIKNTLKSDREVYFHTYIDLLKQECEVDGRTCIYEDAIEFEQPVVPIIIKDVKDYIVNLFTNENKALYLSLIECDGKIYIVKTLKNSKECKISTIKIDKGITDTWNDEWWGKYIFENTILKEVFWDMIEIKDGYPEYKNKECEEKYAEIKKLMSLIKNTILDYMFQLKKEKKDKSIDKEIIMKLIVNKNSEYIKNVKQGERTNIFNITTNSEKKINFSYHEISAKYKEAHKKYVAKYAVTIKDDIDALVIRVSIDEHNYDYFVVYGFKGKRFKTNKCVNRYTGYIYFEDKSLKKIYKETNEENGLKIVNIEYFTINMLEF